MRSNAGIANRPVSTSAWLGSLNLRACRTALHPSPTSNTLRGTNPMGRHNALSGNYPRYTTHLVASHRSGPEEGCSKDGYAMRAPRVGALPAPMSGGFRCYNPSVFASLLVLLGTYVTGRYTRIWAFRCLSTTSEP